MRKNILMLLVPVLFAGCNFLDQDPEELNTLEKVFSSRNDTRKWFARMYSSDYFPLELWGSAYYNHYMFGTDDANNALDWHIPHVLNGSVSPETPVTSTDKYYFQLFYQAIRHCNIFLENVDNCKELDPVTELPRMKAEARFMRAIYHFWILREYGPIPIVDKTFISEKLSRSSYDECVDWICGEIDAAIPSMLEERVEDDYGFPTKGAAMAMKARILLYAASPLFNGNTVYANWKNHDGKQLISQTYDNEKWKKAADAAKAVIDLGKYELLEPKAEDGKPLTFEDYVKNYQKITTTWNKELIWARPQATYWWTMQCLPACFHSWNARDAVSLNLANDYFMADGSEARPLKEWFDNKQWSSEDDVEHGTIKNTFWMFVGREPRFYASTHFPNQRLDRYTHPDMRNQDGSGVMTTIEFWNKGNAGKSRSTGDHNSTGLSPQKNIPLSAYSDKGKGECISSQIPFPVIRLGEIYLDYCEAMNEYAGAASHSTILPYLNEIRKRAGIPEYKGTYTKEQMRHMLMKERRVELAWECHRYFDVRRWFIAHGDNGVLNTPVYGFNVAEGENATDPKFFTMTEGMPRIFRMEHYLAPIKASEVAYNTNLVQAPFY